MEAVWLAATVVAGVLLCQELLKQPRDPHRSGMLCGAIVLTSFTYSMLANEGPTAWNVGLFLAGALIIGFHAWKLRARRA